MAAEARAALIRGNELDANTDAQADEKRAVKEAAEAIAQVIHWVGRDTSEECDLPPSIMAKLEEVYGRS